MSFITPIVRIDGYDLHTMAGLQYVTALRVDDGSPQVLDIFKVAKSDRHKVTGGWIDVKGLEVEGMVEATDETLLTAKLDAIRAALTGVDMTLFVSDGVTNRIWYVSTDGKVNVQRDQMDFVATWSVKFVVANPPYGIEADSSGNPLSNTQSFSLTSTQNVFTPVFLGSARPTPKLSFTLASAGTPDLTRLEFLNRETGQSISIDLSGYTLASGDILVIDSAARNVTFRGRSVGYDGTIPDFVLGSNELEAFFVTANTNIQVGAQKVVNDFEIVRDTIRVAQQFTPASGQNMAFVSLALSKLLSPTGNVRVGLMADSSGSPSGTYIGGTVNIDIATIKSKVRWFTVALAGVGITAGAAYWLVADAPGAVGGQTQHVRWAKSRQDQGFGPMKYWDGAAWQTGVGDMAFRAYSSNSSAQNQTVDTQNNVLNLAATTQKDTPNTTANWDTAIPAIHMNGVLTTPTDVFSGTGYDHDTSGCHFCDAAFWKFTVPGIAGTTVKLTTVTVRAKAGPTGADDLNLGLRNNYNDSTNFATASTVTISSTTYANYTVTFNTNLVAGQTYWIGGGAYGVGEILFDGVQGTTSGTFNSSTTLVAMLTDWSRNSASFSGTGFHSGTAGINHTMNFSYTSRAAAESAVTTQLNSNNADIISTSQVTLTILTGGSTYQGAISANNGTNYTNIVRDLVGFGTENVPAVVGNQLKQKFTLQNTVSLNDPFVTASTLYWREGISLDATTKRASQSFTPTTTGSISTGKLMMLKYGTPGNLTVRIETDSAGSPSGTLANANATATVTAAAISATTFGMVDVTFAGSFSLTAGTVYHIVVVPTTTANDANKVLLHANFGRYGTYEMKRSTNSGTSYTGFTSGASGYDLIFSLSGAGGTTFSANLDVTYNKLWL